MSVLCVHIPSFLLQVAYQATPHLRAKPTALLDAQGRLCALNAPARQAGVTLPMRPQQALLACPALTLAEADMNLSLATQVELMATLGQLDLPTEEHGWGRAYLDLRQAAHSSSHVQTTATDLGKSLRHTLGDGLTPALGWDSSKFTSRAAATYTLPGKMKLVAKTDEPRFLSPLPTHLLPLAASSVQELAWLGIHTLGHFGRLPVQAVVQRYGPAGRTAHQWARGKDDRPVRPTTRAPQTDLTCTFDPPVTQLEPVQSAFRHAFQPQLDTLNQQLNGVRRLMLELTFGDHSTRPLTLLFVEPVGEMRRIIQHLHAQLSALNWPEALISLEVKLLEIGEVILEQHTLFDGPIPTTISLPDLAQRLAPRYGPVFHQAQLTDATHPLAERRFDLQPL